MRTPALLFALLFALSGCSFDDPGSGFGLTERPLDAEPADSDGETDEQAPADDGQPAGWDVSPPEGNDIRVDGVFDCGWMTGPLPISFLFDGEAWQQVGDHSEESSGPRPELAPCFTADAEPEYDHRMYWSEDGLLYFQAGGLNHDLWPTSTEDRWLGNVYPIGGPSEACQQALQEAGADSPMMMSFTVHAVTHPS